jgi:hypothetical protein
MIHPNTLGLSLFWSEKCLYDEAYQRKHLSSSFRALRQTLSNAGSSSSKTALHQVLTYLFDTSVTFAEALVKLAT